MEVDAGGSALPPVAKTPLLPGSNPMLRYCSHLVASFTILALGVIAARAKDAPTDRPAAEKPAAASASSASSATAGPAKASAAAGPSAEQILSWIKELDSEKFSVREGATQRLMGAGETAVEPVAAAVNSKSREVSMRAMQILEHLYRTGNDTVKKKAQAELEKISQNPDSAGAQRAAELLKPQPEVPLFAPNNPAGGIILGPNNFGGQIQIIPGGQQQLQIGNGIIGGNVQIMGGVGPAGVFKFRAQNVNGHRTVDATENDRTVHLEDDPQNGISIKVTEKVDGKEKVTEYKAKDLDDLKKNHTEGAKLYQKYITDRAGAAGNGLGMNIQIQAQAVPGQMPNIAPPGFFPIPNPPGPNPPGPNPALPMQNARPGLLPNNGAPPTNTGQHLAAARRLLADTKTQVSRAAAGKNDPALDKALEELQAADESLAEAERALGQ
jgi:hypothetical protein